MHQRVILAASTVLLVLWSNTVLAHGGSFVHLPFVQSHMPVTPTPAPTATPSGNTIPLLGTNAFISEIDPTQFMVHAAIDQIDYSRPFDSMAVQVDWMQNGAVVKSQTQNAYLITPNCFAVAFPATSVPAVWDEYEVAVVNAVVSQERLRGVVVVSEIREGAHDGPRTTREIRNDNEFPIHGVITYGYTYDRDHIIFECGANDTPLDLAPGQSGFTVTEWFDAPDGEDWRYELTATSSGFAVEP